ncbi:MAG: DinB family protein, partial [Flavobacteriales bacterium]
MEVERMIEELSTVLQAQQARAQVLATLPAEVLLRRPAPDAWNVLEVFEHLNLSSGVYVRGLEDVFARRAARHRPDPEFTPGLLGEWFTTGLEPKPGGVIKWRMRTMKMFDPAR